MIAWIKSLFKPRATFGKNTPKFPRLTALDRRIAASRGVVEPSVCEQSKRSSDD